MDYNRIAADVTLGDKVKIHAFVNLYGCKIGRDTSIGSFVEIQKNATIGTQCKISSHSFICEGVSIGNQVFVGHNVTFINDRYPQSVNIDGSMQTDKDWEVIRTIIADNVSIGSGTTILCGVTIGSGAIIGAGSLVLKDIPKNEVWAGHPAHFIRKINIP